MMPYVGDHLDAMISEIRMREVAARVERMRRWNQAVQDTSAAWRESFGYKTAPIIDGHMVKREVHAMIAKVIDGRLMTLFTPMFVTAESIERSLVIFSILASPSGNGPERYAPKADRHDLISVDSTDGVLSASGPFRDQVNDVKR